MKFYFLFFIFFSIHLLAQDLEQIGKKEMLKIDGSIQSSFNGRKQFDTLYNDTMQFAYEMSAQLNVSILNWNIPFSFFYNKNANGIEQPFKQYGLSPQYKNLTIHLGYRNMSFSKYTLSGTPFLGMGLEYHLKKIDISLMYGQIEKPDQIDTSNLTLESISKEKRVYAVKLNFNQRRFSGDIQMAHYYEIDQPQPIVFDSLNAKKNLCIETNIQIPLTKSLTTQSMFATSVVSRINNESTTMNSFNKHFITINSFTKNYWGFGQNVNCKIKKYNLRYQLNYIESNFYHLANSMIANNFVDHQVSLASNYFKNRLQCMTSLTVKKPINVKVIAYDYQNIHKQINFNWRVNSKIQLNQNCSLLEDNQQSNDSLQTILAQKNTNVGHQMTWQQKGTKYSNRIFLGHQLASQSLKQDTINNRNRLNQVMFTYSKNADQRNIDISFVYMLQNNLIIRDERCLLRFNYAFKWYKKRINEQLSLNKQWSTVKSEANSVVLLQLNQSFQLTKKQSLSLVFKTPLMHKGVGEMQCIVNYQVNFWVL